MLSYRAIGAKGRILTLICNSDNGEKFVKWLEDDKSISLGGVQYAVFGCGSSKQLLDTGKWKPFCWF